MPLEVNERLTENAELGVVVPDGVLLTLCVVLAVTLSVWLVELVRVGVVLVDCVGDLDSDWVNEALVLSEPVREGLRVSVIDAVNDCV